MFRSWIRRDLKRFGVEFLCLLVLLYGDPLQAISEAGSVSAAPEVMDGAPAVADPDQNLDVSSSLLKAAGELWNTAGDRVAAVGSALAGQPWLDALVMLGAVGGGGSAGQEAPAGAPPAPPGFAGKGRASETVEEAEASGAKSALDQIPLVAGWNLVSLPEEPADPDPAAVLAAIGGAYTKVSAHDACDPADPWKLYDPNDPAASDLTVLDHRTGFWIEATSAVDLPSDGTLPATTSFELCTGWNLIGMPIGQPRHVRSVLHPIEGKYVRVFGYDASTPDQLWEGFDVQAPYWANNLDYLLPGRGYWVLVTEDVTLEIANQGPEPTVAISSPQDLDVVTQPTAVLGTVTSGLLESWVLSYRLIGEPEWIEIESRDYPIAAGELGTFDPTLLKNGLYELRLEATDLQGRVVEETIAVSVEGQMKIGHFTLSFVDLAVPVSGLDVEVVRTYDSRDRRQGDFGFGWTLDVRQGSYSNNRPPGDGWRLETGFLPCDTVIETRSHLTVVRLSDREVYRFALRLADGAPTQGGCFATARFDFVDGPLPGTSLEIVGNDSVFFANGSNEVVDADTLELYEPEDVRLTTRDGRIFELDLALGVTRLEDLNGNHLTITPAGIAHSSGRGIEFERDAEGRIERIVDPRGNDLLYGYDEAGDLVSVTDQGGNATTFTYGPSHDLEEIEDARGVTPIRNEYDADGRLARHVDAFGKVIEYDHRLADHQEIVTDRLGHSRLLEYDGRGNVVREVDALGKETLRTFDGEDNLLSETDALGQTTSYVYSSSNDLLSVTDPLGNTTAFTYDGSGRVLTVTDPRGKVTTNAYDGSGNLLSTTEATGATTSFTYDGQGNVLTETDAAGHTTTFAYDGRGNLTSQVDVLGTATSYTYDVAGNRLSETTSRTLPGGSTETLVTSFIYDSLGRLTTTTQPDGSTTSTGYDALGRVISTTDALGRVTGFTYDPLGRQTATTYPGGTSESRTYDAEGRLTTVTDRGGRVTSYVYDAAGRLTRTDFVDGASTRSVYDDVGRLSAAIDARGNTTSYVYDAAGRRTRVVDALGGQTDFAYDAAGNQVAVTDPNRHTTSFVYDDASRRVRTVFPDGTERATGYDALGRRVSETDQAGKTTRFGYDGLGRLTSVTDALGQVTSYAYDELGNRTGQTDANGHITSYEYDRLGRQTKRKLPGGDFETMAYDAAGNLAAATDFLGRTTTYAYDAANRLVTKTLPDSSTVAYGYTATGRRSSVTDGRGTTSSVYDGRDRLVELTYPDGRRLTYAHDANGNRTALTAHLAGQVLTTGYSYDALNRLDMVTDPDGRLYDHGYDANGNRTSLAYPNGVATSYVYDPLNRLTDLSTTTSVGDVVQSCAYTLGPAGNRTRIDEHDGTVRSYGYDDLYRLTTETVSDASGAVYAKTFGYDPVGNRLSQVTTGAEAGTVAYAYDERDRLVDEGGQVYGWDINGNLTTKVAEATYGWDFEDRLERVVLADGTLVAHTYDADGVRVRTETTPPGGPTEVVDYLVDTSGALSQVVAETDGAGSLKAYYVRGDDLLAVIRPVTGVRFYHADGLGSIRALTDDTEAITDRWSFTAFGEFLEHVGSDENAYLFAGEPLDPNSGFYYNRARWMDPSVGRFTAVDTFVGFSTDPPSLHRYLYGGLDPVNETDPAGLSELLSFSIAGAIVGLVSGIIEGVLTPGVSPIESGAWGLLLGGVLGPVFGPIVKKGGLAARIIIWSTLALGSASALKALRDGHLATATFRTILVLLGAVGVFARLIPKGPTAVFRVQGGSRPPKISHDLVSIDSAGNVKIAEATLNVSTGDASHAQYYLAARRPGGVVYEWQVPRWFMTALEKIAIPQHGASQRLFYQIRPQLTDPTTPGTSYQLPAAWAKFMELVASNGRVYR